MMTNPLFSDRSLGQNSNYESCCKSQEYCTYEEDKRACTNPDIEDVIAKDFKLIWPPTLSATAVTDAPISGMDGIE